MLCLERRVSYRRLRKEFGLDDETIEDVRHELIVKRLAVDEGGQGLAFVGAALFEIGDAAPRAFAPAAAPIALPPVLSVPAAIAPTPEAERRQLTVMFCDLVGSTALSTGMDPEDLRDVIASYQSRCSAAIRRYDGFVAKYMGDGILVYFGYPRAHEDEAERSVRAGLDIVDAMAELNAATRRPPGVELAVRIGIATGPVIVGDQIGEGTASETAVVGETPNLAARLQGLAQPNQIVVSAATRANAGISPVGVFTRNDDAGSGGPVTRPTPTKPKPGALTQTRSPGFKSFKVLLYHVPPPAQINPYFTASPQERELLCPKQA